MSEPLGSVQTFYWTTGEVLDNNAMPWDTMIALCYRFHWYLLMHE